MLAGLCVVGCGSGQFVAIGGTDLSCYPCSSSCLTCQNISSNCTSCSPLSLTYLYAPTNKCTSKCPPEYYANSSTQQCTPCSPPCLYCSSASTCTFCQAGYVLTTYVNGTTACTVGCGSGYYNKSNICTQCSLTCLTCLTANYCTTCAPGYYLYGGICSASCSNGFYISLASNSTRCETCQSPCLSCYLYSSNCTACDISGASSFKNYYVSNGTGSCVNGCPSTYYPD